MLPIHFPIFDGGKSPGQSFKLLSNYKFMNTGFFLKVLFVVVPQKIKTNLAWWQNLEGRENRTLASTGLGHST